MSQRNILLKNVNLSLHCLNVCVFLSLLSQEAALPLNFFPQDTVKEMEITDVNVSRFTLHLR